MTPKGQIVRLYPEKPRGSYFAISEFLYIMARLSGLQREVLKLYRACIRSVKTKPEQNREHWRLYIREEFGKHRHLPKMLFSVIEHLIRVGHRRYEMYLNPNIKDIH